MFSSLETLSSIKRTGLPILVELIDLVHSVITFLSQMTLPRWLSFLLGFQTVILVVLLFWIYLFLLLLVFVLQWHVLISVSIDFPSNSQRDAPFHRIAYDNSHADWDGLRDHLRDVPWEDIFKLDASAAASEFCQWVQVGIDLYIPERKYQVKSHSFPWFSAACAAVIAHRNHFFRLYQKDKSSASKAKFGQASNPCKRVSEVFGKLVNNRIVDHLEKSGLFSDFHMILGFRDQLQIFSQSHLIELLRLLTDHGLLEL